MRLSSKLSLALILTSVLSSQAWAAEKFASIKVSIDDAELVKKDAGIRTLFVIIYDSESPRPMPYGAMKVTLKEDAKGTFYTGDLTTDNVQLMAGGAMPKKIKIKARLDKDGSAGGDQPGDLVGIVENVKPGDSTVIKIAKAM